MTRAFPIFSWGLCCSHVMMGMILKYFESRLIVTCTINDAFKLRHLEQSWLVTDHLKLLPNVFSQFQKFPNRIKNSSTSFLFDMRFSFFMQPGKTQISTEFKSTNRKMIVCLAGALAGLIILCYLFIKYEQTKKEVFGFPLLNQHELFSPSKKRTRGIFIRKFYARENIFHEFFIIFYSDSGTQETRLKSAE